MGILACLLLQTDPGEWIERLGSEQEAVREAATRALAGRGWSARPLLERIRELSSDPEVDERAGFLLSVLEKFDDAFRAVPEGRQDINRVLHELSKEWDAHRSGCPTEFPAARALACRGAAAFPAWCRFLRKIDGELPNRERFPVPLLDALREAIYPVSEDRLELYREILALRGAGGDLRECAADALRRLGTPSAIAALAGRIESEGRPDHGVVSALCSIPKTEARLALVDFLRRLQNHLKEGIPPVTAPENAVHWHNALVNVQLALERSRDTRLIPKLAGLMIPDDRGRTFPHRDGPFTIPPISLVCSRIVACLGGEAAGTEVARRLPAVRPASASHRVEIRDPDPAR